MNALHALMIYHEIKENEGARKVNRMIFFAGKAAPGYKEAKDIIRFIYILSRKIFNDPVVRNHLRIVFIPNYNVTNAEKIIPAADLSQQISTAGMEASGTGNMKLAINGALTIGTEDGANVEMREEIGDSWWPFSFGQSAEENQKLKESYGYSTDSIIDKNPKIMKAMEALRDRSLVENEAEHETLCSIYKCLMEGVDHQSPDRYLVLNDLCSYYATQKKVEELFATPLKWAEFVIHNIAGMGKFSADVSIKNYAEKIWKLQSLSISDDDLELIRSEYSQLDRCRILTR
jgi:starch phosphorylase